MLGDADAVAVRPAGLIAENAWAAYKTRGLLLLRKRRSPSMADASLRTLAREQAPWAAFHIFQVDERIAPAGPGPESQSPIGANNRKEIK